MVINPPRKFRRLTPNEIRILRRLYHTRIPQTQYELAKSTGLSWGTTKKYAGLLKEKRLIVPKPNKQFAFNYDILTGKRMKRKRDNKWL